MGGINPQGNSPGSGPQHGVIVESVLRHIHEWISAGYSGAASGTPQEGYQLPPGYDSLGVEVGGVYAGGDALFCCPQHRIIVIPLGGYIQEGALGRFRGWASLGTPQEGHYLPPGAGLLRHKVGTVYAGSNPGIDSPQDRRIVVPSFFNVHKRVWPGTNGFGSVFVAPGLAGVGGVVTLPLSQLWPLGFT